MPHPGTLSVANSVVSANFRQGHDVQKIAALEAEVSNLRIQNSKLLEETQRPGYTDSSEKINILSELNDKLELDLDLALKELALNKRKADSAEAQLAKVKSRNVTLEQEIAHLTNTTTTNEQRLATKRDWAERRLHEEESTITDLQRQATEAQAEIVRQKRLNQQTKESYDKEYKRQEALIATMKEAHRVQLAEAREAVRTASRRARDAAPNAKASQVFAKFDANGDGVMDEEEFAAAYAAFAKPQHRPYPAPGSQESRFDYQTRR